MVACMPTLANAHAWNIPYYLPVPLWLYAYAATGTLIISFMVLAFASGTKTPGTESRSNQRGKGLRIPASRLHAAQLASAIFLVLLIVSGIAGTQNPFRSLSMSGFWIWFYLGSIYVSAILGDIYAFANPIALILRIAAHYFPSLETGRYRYPQRFALYPALFVYIALIALELFGAGRPRDVSLFLIGYVAYAVAGSLCFGRELWLRHFDTFGMLCGLCARLSPLKWSSSSKNEVTVKLRNPVTDISRDKPSHISVVAFLSFMLASTAYDGLRDTATWNTFFWRGIYPHIINLFPTLGKNYAFSGEMILAWQWLTFAAMSAAYYCLFRGFCALEAITSRSSFDGKHFSRQFCFALLPIAFFYNVCHYFTLFLDQGRKIIALAADPLGLGWKLFSMSSTQDSAAQSLINVGYIWHAQVLLILAGHILSVYITHAISIRSRDLGGTAIIGQLPLLVLTIVLTISGLWILSLPLA
uniref:Putative fenitrothion hydrolase protein FedB n=2 Tax=Ralstonia syzygii TaxID=28097 RepID=G3AA41_9RALS|nr:putative fenitrothion hydrolase protein FedB [Ralstonia syzygii R24]